VTVGADNMSEQPSGQSQATAQEYSPGCVWTSLTFGLAAIGFCVWITMEERARYAPARDPQDREAVAERAYLEGQRDAAAESRPTQVGRTPQRLGETQQRRMTFGDCLAHIAGTTEAIGQQPALLLNSDDIRVARFRFNDGDVTITCSRADRTMTLSHEPR
jgi:hypothetical protein